MLIENDMQMSLTSTNEINMVEEFFKLKNHKIVVAKYNLKSVHFKKAVVQSSILS